ncbi:MAG: hypothetical protein IJ088_12105, partial [Clostridia bacterium]|nr:hypothetical protein [Clostridia bacterium]
FDESLTLGYLVAPLIFDESLTLGYLVLNPKSTFPGCFEQFRLSREYSHFDESPGFLNFGLMR